MAEEKTVTKRASAYVTDSGRIFLDGELKKYELPQSKQIEEDTTFKVGIIEPPYDLMKLMSWLELSVVHSSCVHTKVQDAFGIGWFLKEEDEGEEGKKTHEVDEKRLELFFNKCNEQEDIISVLKKVGRDYESCGNAYMEVVRDIKDTSIKALYHVNATTIRLVKTKDKWIQMIGNKKVYFKKWGDERIMDNITGKFVDEIEPDKVATELVQIIQYTHKSPYYGLPEWLPALFQMYGEMKEKEYNLDFFSSYGVPAYAVILEGADFDEPTKDLIQKYFETELKGNPHRTMVFSTPEGATIKFEKLSVQTKEASFRIYRRDNRDDILTAHHVPPYRASIVEKGQLGGSVAPDIDRIYLDSVINPRQRAMTWIINELFIKEAFEIKGWLFEFKDIDVRDKKMDAEIDKEYFMMGARTSNEILVAQGLEPYEGGDVYYIPANLVPIGLPPKDSRYFQGVSENEDIDEDTDNDE